MSAISGPFAAKGAHFLACKRGVYVVWLVEGRSTSETHCEAKMWDEALDKRVQDVVRVVCPVSCFDDALQEARLAIWKAEPGREPRWYIRLGLWRALDWCRKEGRAVPTMDMEALTERMFGEDG